VLDRIVTVTGSAEITEPNYPQPHRLAVRLAVNPADPNWPAAAAALVEAKVNELLAEYRAKLPPDPTMADVAGVADLARTAAHKLRCAAYDRVAAALDAETLLDMIAGDEAVRRLQTPTKAIAAPAPARAAVPGVGGPSEPRFGR